MTKLFKIYLTFTIYCFSLNNTFSQCEIIPPYTSLPTGSNMTVFLTPGFFQTIPNLSPGAYIVGLSPQGTTFGSIEIYNANQTLVVMHGDDTTTPEVDGMLSGDEVIFKIVSGDSIYHVDMSEPILYSTNQLYQITNASFELECPQDSDNDEVEDNSENSNNFNCFYPSEYTGNTGSNMTLMLTPNFTSGFPNLEVGAYIVALSQNNTVYGSVDIYGQNQTMLAIWGDDTTTPEIDGASPNELISLQIISGDNLYNLEGGIMAWAATYDPSLRV